MIISRTPFRVSFLGGGSDLAAFYQRQRGAVLSTTIDKYMYISVHPYFERDKILVKYSQTEKCSELAKLEHPLVRECLRRRNYLSGLEISSTADVPASTGLGSSSAFTVGLLHSLSAQRGQFVAKNRLAEEACQIEIDMVGSPIGKQDQYATAYGGLNLIEFLSSGDVVVTPVSLTHEIIQRLQRRLLMFYTHAQRDANSILADQQKQIATEGKFRTQEKMVELAYDARDRLFEGNLDAFARLMHTGWELKQRLSTKISNQCINDAYERALKAGAGGGKLLGAGGGGFLLLYCVEEKQDRLREELRDLQELSFHFEFGGSQIIFAYERDPAHESEQNPHDAAR
ncbi:MAG: GHMP kinase [Deltaproteobacteria bacterium RIFOXYA12_FULL_58_15]|nr:MAG: GHMP kinase [Deltaproteobacteria bacterium RIFOXYA12_FULL_58_15]OGR13911.1 MAG: GHMP kinase [Deltaproteobacteria bacterium RIFOXYB12_FULL_58_9]